MERKVEEPCEDLDGKILGLREQGFIDTWPRERSRS
jgi:hypothetical protein